MKLGKRKIEFLKILSHYNGLNKLNAWEQGWTFLFKLSPGYIFL